jgi:hypothetical protein
VAVEAGQAYIPVRADMSGFGKQVETGVATETKGATGKVKSVGKSFAAAVGGAFAIQQGFNFLGGAFDAAGEAQKVSAQTEAVLKSTGGAANVTADEVGKLAERLKNMSGIEDEAIQAGQNMLLTFTNIRNEAGEGNDVFNQATETLLDMSVATGTDAKSAAVQLGKALNDPIKGISALSRVGVTFTDEQKEQIKALVGAGDAAAAQKIILKELNREFGGSAKAAGDARTPQQRLAMTMGDLQETIGLKLLPVMEKLAGFLAKNKSVIVVLAGVIGATLVAAFVAWAAAAWAAAAPTIAAAAPILALVAAIALVGFAIYKLVTEWETVWATVKRVVGTAVGWVVDQFKKIPSGIKTAFTGLANLITAPYKAAFRAIARLWNNSVGKLSFKIPKWVPGIGGKGFNVPDIPTFHDGGVVPGRPGQEVMALLQAGETVIPAGQGVGRPVEIINNIVKPDAAWAGLVSRQIAWGESL